MSDVAIKLHSLSVLIIAQIIFADSELALAASAPRVRPHRFCEGQVVTCTTCDINDDVLEQTLNQLGLCSHTMAHLLTLLTVEEVLAPKIYSTSLGQTEGMVCSALDLRDLKLLSEQRWAHHKGCSRVNTQLAMSIVTPSVRITYTLLRHFHKNTPILTLLCRWPNLLSRLLDLLFFLLLLVLHLHISASWLLFFYDLVVLSLAESSRSIHFLLYRFLSHKRECFFLTNLDSMRNLLVFRHVRRSGLLVLSGCSILGNLELQHCITAASSSCCLIIAYRTVRLLRSIAFHAGLALK